MTNRSATKGKATTGVVAARAKPTLRGRAVWAWLLDPAAHYNEQEKSLDCIEPAWAKAALCLRMGGGEYHYGHGSRRRKPLLAIHQGLEAIRKRFEAGDFQALLHAVMLCGQENLPMPAWLATAYTDRMTAFLTPGGPTSLDEAFASPRMPTTPTRGRQARRDWQLAVKLWFAVWAVAKDHRGLDPALRAVLEADRSLGLGLTRARELVKMIDSSEADLRPGYTTLSRFWSIKRKGVI